MVLFAKPSFFINFFGLLPVVSCLTILSYLQTKKESDTGNNEQDECRNHRKQEAEKEIRYNGRSVSRKRREGRVSSPEEKRHVSFTRRWDQNNNRTFFYASLFSLFPSFSCFSLRSKDKRRGTEDRRTRQENKRRKSVVLLSFPLLLSLSISSSLLRVLMSLFFSIDWHKIRDKIGNQSQERETVGPVIDEEKKECFWHETRGKRVKLMRIN